VSIPIKFRSLHFAHVEKGTDGYMKKPSAAINPV